MPTRSTTPARRELRTRCNNGQIKNVFNYGSGPANQTLGGWPAFSTSSDVSLYTDSSGIQQIFGHTASGDLAVVDFNLGNGGWEEHPLGRAITPNALTASISASQTAIAGNLASQDVFKVGADGLVREDAYSYSSDTDSGLTTIDPNSTFSAGTMLTAYTDGNSTNVFAVNGSGSLTWAQYVPGSGWSGFLPVDSFSFTAAAFAPGAPISAAAQNGYLYLFGVGTDGYVREYVYDSATNAWTLDDLNNLPQFSQAAQLSVWDDGSSIDLFGVVAGGGIERLHESGGNWTSSAVATDGGLSAGTPLAIAELGGDIYLFGVNGAGMVDEISYDGTAWSSPSTLSVGADTFANNSALGMSGR